MRRKITKQQAASVLGRLGGLKGGKARMASLTPKERSELGRKAAAARWGSDAKRRFGSLFEPFAINETCIGSVREMLLSIPITHIDVLAELDEESDGPHPGLPRAASKNRHHTLVLTIGSEKLYCVRKTGVLSLTLPQICDFGRRFIGRTVSDLAVAEIAVDADSRA